MLSEDKFNIKKPSLTVHTSAATDGNRWPVLLKIILKIRQIFYIKLI